MIIPEYSPSESEIRHAVAVFSAYDALRNKGWQEVTYAPKDTQLWLIEAGSTGFHSGYRDADGSFWVVDRMDTWPSYPILFKLQEKTEGKTTREAHNEQADARCICKGFYRPVHCPVHGHKARGL